MTMTQCLSVCLPVCLLLPW